MRIEKLDGLRGLLCIGILVFHYQQNEFCFGNHFPSFIADFFLIKQSYTFVDFFFALSGFVISLNYNENIELIDDSITFLKKRWVRLYPLLVYTVIVNILFVIYFMYPYETHYPYYWNYLEIVVRTLDTLLFTNSNPFLFSSHGMNRPSWSISAEMTAYLMFAIVATSPTSRYRNYVYAIIISISIAFCLYENTYFFYSDYGFFRCFICFIMGCYSYYLYKKSHVNIPNYLEYLIFIIALVVLFTLNELEEGVAFQLFALFSIPLLYGSMLFILSNTNGIISKFLNSRPMQHLGKLSYSIYLNHYVIISFTPVLFFGILRIPKNTIDEILVFLLSIALTYVHSCFSYKYIEVKMGLFLKNKLKI